MAWTITGGHVTLDLRALWLCGVWEEVHQRYLAAKPMSVTAIDIGKEAQGGQKGITRWEWSDHT
jgi:hypothetical protein